MRNILPSLCVCVRFGHNYERCVCVLSLRFMSTKTRKKYIFGSSFSCCFSLPFFMAQDSQDVIIVAVAAEYFFSVCSSFLLYTHSLRFAACI